MTVKYTVVERMVGLLILLTFFSILGTVVAVGRGQNWFMKHNTYWALYKEGYNLQPGVKVKLLRTDIGQVTEVGLTEANQVKVSMRILAEYASRIRADSQAAIESPTFIGSEYINIIPGTVQTPLIEPGGQIPSKEQKKISDYLEEFGFEHKRKTLEEMLENVASMIRRIEKPDGPVFGTMANVQKLTDDIATGRGTLGKVVASDEIYKALLKELDAVHKILVSVDGVVNAIKRTEKPGPKGAPASAASSPDVVTQIQNILSQMEKVSKQLEKAMNDVPEISSQARQGIRDVNQILESIKNNFLIRSNLAPQPKAESHGVELRGE